MVFSDLVSSYFSPPFSNHHMFREWKCSTTLSKVTMHACLPTDRPDRERATPLLVMAKTRESCLVPAKKSSSVSRCSSPIPISASNARSPSPCSRFTTKGCKTCSSRLTTGLRRDFRCVSIHRLVSSWKASPIFPLARTRNSTPNATLERRTGPLGRRR